MLTEEQKKDYVTAGDAYCPYCQCDDPECTGKEWEDNMIIAGMWCPQCGKHWDEVYTLTSIYEREEKDTESVIVLPENMIHVGHNERL